jgi:predicted O-linked N-acetylglucosamine transferase (SPINDLY family)
MATMQDPDAQAEALLDEGVARHGQMQLDAARVLYQQALKAQPRNPRGWHLLGLIALQTGAPLRALESIRTALDLDPSNAAAYNDYGQALYQLQRFDAAVDAYDKAIAIAANDPAFHCNRGNALYELQRFEAAIASFEAAVRLDPNFAGGFYNRGAAQYDLMRFEAAIESFDRAIGLKPDHAHAHNDRGNACVALNRIEAALASYTAAIRVQPGFAGAHFNRGQMQDELGQHAAAAASYETALALNPDFRYARGHRLLARMQSCQWGGLASDLEDLEARIARRDAAATPFAALALLGSAPLQQQAAQHWVHAHAPPQAALGPIARRSHREKIRVGYFSADFCEHPVARLTAELYESHDRERFEIWAFSLRADARDPMRLRLERAFDRFIEAREISDMEVARMARALDIDIAVDLTGFTKGCRPAIFALRAAPIQVSYLGYLGTMGAAYMDYLIADAAIVPPSLKPCLSESIVYLPSYQANDRKRPVPAGAFDRAALGLPPTGFVFCCFSANYKITPAVFDRWMRILQRTPDSVLFLFASSDAAAGNLIREARNRGVAGQRLIFGAKLAEKDYLARLRNADLYLDTWPYNAGTTASDALWAGLPILTCAGETFASRVASSLLRAIGLPELITTTPAEYEELAVSLAADPPRMARIKHTLAEHRLTAPLFDTRSHTRSLEAAYRSMQARHSAGMPPDDIVVA